MSIIVQCCKVIAADSCLNLFQMLLKKKQTDFWQVFENKIYSQRHFRTFENATLCYKFLIKVRRLTEVIWYCRGKFVPF